MNKFSRRTFLATGAATVSVVALPGAALTPAAVSAPFIPPTTNILHMGARFSARFGFSDAEIMTMLKVEDLTPKYENLEPQNEWDSYLIDERFNLRLKSSLDQARDRAESDNGEIYTQGQILLEIRKKIMWHFNFKAAMVHEWLDEPNQYLNGITFRSLMIKDLQMAAKSVDFALTGIHSQDEIA